MEKYGTGGRATYDNIYGACAMHAGYLRLQIHTLRLCNTHCLSTATMVALTRLNITLYVSCLSCYFVNAF